MAEPRTHEQTYTWVADAPTLAALTARVAQAEYVGIDTEADSLHHYFEKLCLIQISVGEDCFIVDPFEPLDFAPLMQARAGSTLILHGADYDLRLLRRAFGFEATAVFDTMLAARLLGYERFSLQALVERHVNIVLSKHGQRADWSRRPLGDELLRYASDDVRFLDFLRERLTEELNAMGRLPWLQEMCRRVMEGVRTDGEAADPEKVWRVKGWTGLSPRALAYLRAVWQWRDREAQRIDRPSFMVMRTELLVELAQWFETNETLEGGPRMPRNIAGQRLGNLMRFVAQARALPDNELPGPLRGGARQPRDLQAEELLVKLKVMRDEVAKNTGLDPGLVAPNQILGDVARAKPNTVDDLRGAGIMCDWQADLLGEQAVDLITNAATPTLKRKPRRRGRTEKTATSTTTTTTEESPAE